MVDQAIALAWRLQVCACEVAIDATTTKTPPGEHMFAITRPALTMAASFLSISLGFGSAASADHHDRIDRFANRIQRKAQRLVKETNHYRHTPQYRHLVHDAQLLCDTAAHIHDVTHFEGNRVHLKRDVATISRVFQHLEDLFYHVEKQAARGNGHLHGHTGHVKNLLNQIERDVHNLSNELAKVCQNQQHVACSVPQTYQKFQSHDQRGHGFQHGHSAYRNPRFDPSPDGNSFVNDSRSSHYRTARGFSIGGGSSRIWIGY